MNGGSSILNHFTKNNSLVYRGDENEHNCAFLFSFSLLLYLLPCSRYTLEKKKTQKIKEIFNMS